MKHGLPPTAAPGAPGCPFETRAALFAWLEQHGLEHLARLNLEALAPGVDPALWPQLRALGARRRLVELASTETLARAADWLPSSRLGETLPPLVWRFLEEARAEAERARAGLAGRLRLPEDPRRHALHARLLELRARFPDSVAPRPQESLRPDALELDAELPGFHFLDLLPCAASVRAGGGFVRPRATLNLSPGAPGSECSCGAPACVHALATLDAALLWLHQPGSEAFLRSLESLSQPAWQRTLLALDKVMEESDGARGAFELTWRLHVVEDYAVEVAAFVGKPGRKGQRGGATRLSRRRLLLEYGTRLSSEDGRIAALLPEEDEPAPPALLEALVDHPRLVLLDSPELAVRVERTAVGLVAAERAGAVWVSAGIEGTALPAALVERVRRARPGEPLFLWDPASRRLTLLEVKAELRSLLGVLLREGNLFPPESRGALLESLAKWAQRVPVAMPRSVMGESVPALLDPVLRLEVGDAGGVGLELLIRPLEDGPALPPGEGARDLHLRRGERAVHAVRDLRLEEAAAQALCDALPLSEAHRLEGPFRFGFDSPQAALALLAASTRLDPAPQLEWKGAPLRALGAHGARSLAVRLKRRGEWFGALGGLSVGGERVELARLLESVRRRERFVRVEAHTYVELSETLRRHLEKLADHVHVTRRGLELGPSAAAALQELETEGAALDADAGWRELVARVEAAAALQPRVPAALEAQLRPYQREGFDWLARLAAMGAGGVLADDMGLGKTVQALALLLERARLGPGLVVAPTSVAFNWKEEAARFAPSLRFTLLSDAPDRAAALAALGPGEVVVVSYALLVRESERLEAQRFATAVFDEAQSLKNSHTQRFRAARGLRADFKVALSGTPMENHLGELWSLFAVVFPALLGSWETFRTRFAAPIEKQVDPAAAPALGRVLAPFLLRRTKAQVEAELPARTEVRVPVVLSAAEWQLYEDARLAALSDLETSRSKMREQERRVEVLAALTRLRLLASHPRLYDARSQLVSSKLTRLLELIAELRAEGQRALVFSQFTSHLALVREALEARGLEYVYLDGATPQRARGERVREFQEGRAPLFLISLKAGGFGLNLTAASSVIHLDPWWNPAVEDQASDRAHRIGQQRPVTIYRLVALGTIEELMLSLHARKRALVAQVLSGADQAGKLSTRELVELLSQGLRAPEEAAESVASAG